MTLLVALLTSLFGSVALAGPAFEALSTRIAKEAPFEDGLIDEGSTIRGVYAEIDRLRQGGRLSRAEALALAGALDDRQGNTRGSVLGLADLAHSFAKEHALPGTLRARLGTRIENGHQEFRRHLRFIDRIQAGKEVLRTSPTSVVNRDGGPGVYVLKSRSLPSGIVKAGSRFLDDDGFSPSLDVVGTANLVIFEKTNRVVAITAAHVVGGRDPWIEVEGRRQPLRSLLIDSDLDVAVGEVDVPLAPAAFSFAGNGTLVVSHALGAQSDEGHVPWVSLGESRAYHRNIVFALTPWSEFGTEEPDPMGAETATVSYGSRLVRLASRVSAGNSGSLAIDEETEIVVGLISESHYYLGSAFLVPVSSIKTTLEAHAAGQRGPRSPTRWRMHKGLTYRRFAGGIDEAAFTIRPTGKGVIGQPGKGVIGQPGGARFNPWTASPRDVFETFSLSPGLLVNGKPIVAIQVTSTTGGTPRLLNADAAVLRWLERERDNHHVEYLSADELDLPPQRLTLTVRRSLRDQRVELDTLRLDLDSKARLKGELKFMPVLEVRGASGDTYFVDIRGLYFTDLTDTAEAWQDLRELEGNLGPADLTQKLRIATFSRAVPDALTVRGPYVTVRNSRSRLETKVEFRESEKTPRRAPVALTSKSIICESATAKTPCYLLDPNGKFMGGSKSEAARLYLMLLNTP